ncbi:hypothetical protein L6452_43372 [Arctium lappa]|uniref:Uncharacterized protein n=1 Tax=Arctium lappa TaxID=4217 RepID=A0ACB8XMM6_ARCLA|nr:hypothetical protein L6452_43372 [Arctium lappa]
MVADPCKKNTNIRDVNPRTGPLPYRTKPHPNMSPTTSLPKENFFFFFFILLKNNKKYSHIFCVAFANLYPSSSSSSFQSILFFFNKKPCFHPAIYIYIYHPTISVSVYIDRLDAG